MLSPSRSPSLADLIGRLAAVEERVRAAVAARRAVDPEPDDAFRGLYLSDEQADRLLEPGYPGRLRASSNEGMSPADADGARADRLERDAPEAAGEELRLPTLARRCGLTGLDVDILLVALAPDLESRFEKLYGYLHDDVSRRRASPGLALELGGRSPLDAAARARCGRNGALVAAGLLVVEDADRPFLTRSLRVPDRVAAFLLGDDGPEPGLGAVLVDPPDVGGAIVDRLARALTAGVSLTYLRQLPGGDALTVAASACRRAGLAVLAAQLGAASTTTDGPDPAVLAEAVREARLRGAVLVAGPLDAQSAAAVAGLVTSVQGTSKFSPQIVLFGRGGWEPETPGPAPLSCDVEPLPAAEQAALWSAELGGSTQAGELAAFRLTPRQVRRTVAAARALAAAGTGREISREISREIGIDIRTEHLVAAARAQNATGLERLARRVQPSVTWDDLVLPARTGIALRHLAGRSAHRGTVLDDWGLRRGGGRGEGVTSLFAGESGTGKTMAAEVVAGSLGVDLYVIDLSVVVDKYIGETEKNLERIFVGAEGLNAVLFFDEADALFGKRSEVSDARDRYANVEVAYLLQRMESFDGTAILATNLAANLDEAFRRRLSVVVEFTRPEETERRELWRRMLRCVPLADDVDLDFCGRAFTLAGGDIRNAVVTAAYLGAANGRVVDMRDLVTAISLEYRKLGRLCLPDEFGPYADVLHARD
ncbi:ATP-binding protein [Frankia sp. Cas4]|uniref:AAA family ATPase n=1 Tax=Frankia sp. Cas4 TaxID=3073927 RepID=UPI002AD2B0B2|nr:ATP-binding protein [Frankia sp. Cas4]